MKLTPAIMEVEIADLNRRRQTLYGRWKDSWDCYQQAFNFSPPEGFATILPGTGKRIVDTAARLLYQDVSIHCPPKAQGKGAEDNADKREKALQASLWCDGERAAQEDGAAPLEAVAKLMLLFGEGVLLTTIDDNAFREEPKRKTGEDADSYEQRHMAWKRLKASSYPLRTVSPPAIYVMRDLDTGHTFLRYRITSRQLDQLDERFGNKYPGDTSPAPPASTQESGQGTVMWEEAWSEDRHIIVVGGDYGRPLLDSAHYLGFLPFSFALPTTGLPGIIYSEDVGISGDLEQTRAGILTGLENLIETQARRLTQLDANIAVSVWQAPEVELPAGMTDLPEGFAWAPFGEVNVYPEGTKPSYRPVPQLGQDIYRSLEFLDNLIEISTGTRILAGFRQGGASSGYESQMLAALAALMLEPYIRALTRCIGVDLKHRLMYVETPFFPSGMEYGGMTNKGWATGVLKESDIDSYQVIPKLALGLPQDEERAQAKAEKAMALGLWSKRKGAEEGWGTENPDEEQVQIIAEQMVAAARDAMKEDIMAEYDPLLAERYREARLSQIAQQGAQGGTQFAVTGGQAPGRPGVAARPGLRRPPPAAGSPEETDQIMRQAEMAARGGMPMPQGVA
jgi:hypothetical protein